MDSNPCQQRLARSNRHERHFSNRHTGSPTPHVAVLHNCREHNLIARLRNACFHVHCTGFRWNRMLDQAQDWLHQRRVELDPNVERCQFLGASVNFHRNFEGLADGLCWDWHAIAGSKVDIAGGLGLQVCGHTHRCSSRTIAGASSHFNCFVVVAKQSDRACDCIHRKLVRHCTCKR